MFTHWKMDRSAFYKSLITLVSTTLILSACSLFPKEEEVLAPPLVEPAQVQYEVAKVTRGTIVKAVKGSSTFTATEQKELSFKDPKGRRLKTFLVKNGDKVKRGQVLAELETGDLLHEIEMAKYELRRAQVELQGELQNNTYEIQSAQIEVQKAEMEAKVMGTKLSMLELEKAKLRVKELQDPQKKNYLIESAKLNVTEKQLDLAELQKKLEDSKLVCPIDGEVVFVGNEAVGDELEAYQTLVTVADPKSLFIIYSAPTAEHLQDIQVGMKVTIILKDKTKLEGKVVQAPNSLPNNLSPEQLDLYSRSLLVSAANIPATVEIGTPVDIEVMIQKHDNALMIPKVALRDFSGRQYVQVLDGKSKKEIDVETGIQNATEVEIVKGLQEGQLVILE